MGEQRGEYVWKERRHKRGGQRREDDGTGVEFTHPAGSAHYWHICFSVMSHPFYGGSERKCGIVSERETQTETYENKLSVGSIIVSIRTRILVLCFKSTIHFFSP